MFRPKLSDYKKTDGTRQLNIEIRMGTSRSYYPTGLYLKKGEWDIRNQTATGNDAKAMKINRVVRNTINELEDVYLDMLTTDRGSITPRRIKEKLLFKSMTSVVEYIEGTIIPKHKAVSTRYGYQGLANHIKRFDRNATFEDITCDWVDRFKSSLSKRLSRNSVNTTLTRLKSVINSAERSEVYRWRTHPFSDIVMRNEKKVGEYLTREQLQQLEQYTTTDMQKRQAVDFWLAMYYAHGARFGDALNFQWAGVKDGVLTYRMAKVQDSSSTPVVTVPIHDKLQRILNRYYVEGRKYVFPYMDERLSIGNKQRFDKEKNYLNLKIRKQLKEVAREIGVEKLTAHMARRSFANHLREEGADIHSIQTLMNHSSSNTTSGYMGGGISDYQQSMLKKVYV